MQASGQQQSVSANSIKQLQALVGESHAEGSCSGIHRSHPPSHETDGSSQTSRLRPLPHRQSPAEQGSEHAPRLGEAPASSSSGAHPWAATPRESTGAASERCILLPLRQPPAEEGVEQVPSTAENLANSLAGDQGEVATPWEASATAPESCVPAVALQNGAMPPVQDFVGHQVRIISHQVRTISHQVMTIAYWSRGLFRV